MSLVQSATATSSYYQQSAATSVVSVAAAFSAIKINPRAKLDIVDTVANIEKNLDDLKKVVNNVKTITLDGAASGVLNLTSKQLLAPGVSTLLNKKNQSGADNGIRLNVSGVLTKDVANVSSNTKVSQFSVQDSASNIALKLSNLTASAAKLQEIRLTNSAAPINISYAQYASNGDALGKLRGTFGLGVSGATAEQALTLKQSDVANVVSAVSILDHSQAIADHLDALQGLGVTLKALASNDNAIMKVNASQLQSDKAVIGKLYKGYQFAVFNVDSTSAMDLNSNKKVVTMDIVDTAANLSKNLVLLDRLGSQVHSVRVTDTDPVLHPLTLNAVDFLTHGNVLSKIINTDPDATEQATTPLPANNIYKLNIVGASAVDAQAIKSNDHIQSIAIADTSAAIAVNLDDLNANSKVTGISQIGNPAALNVSYAQLDAVHGDTKALALLGNEGFALNVSGVAAADALGLLNRTVDGTANGQKLNIASMSVSDSAANILAHLDDLAQLGKSLTTITQADAGQSLQLTAGNWTSHMGVLSKIVGGYGVDLTAVSATQALSLAPDLRVRTLNVSDSGAAISANLDALMGLGSKLSSISQSDHTSLQITGKQFDAYAANALVKLGADYKLAVSSAKANQIQAITSNAHVTDVQVADTVSNIGANLAALKTAVAADAPPNIRVDMLGTPSAFTLTKTQLDSYAAALGKINGNYTVKALDVALADASDVAANTHVISMDVNAASTELSDPSQLSDLRALGTKLNRIAQTDAGTALSMTVTNWSSNLGVLEKIKGYSVALTEANVANGLTLLTKPHVKSISITDSSTQISGNFDKLMALGSKLQAMAVTPSDTGHLKLSMAQWSAAAAAPTLAKLSGDYVVDIGGASATQAQSLVANDQIGGIAITDTAANISAKLDELKDNVKVNALQLSDPATPVTLSMQQFSEDAALLAKFQGGYGFAVTHAGAADVGNLFSHSHVIRADVEGSASDIQGALGILTRNSARLKSLTLTDTGDTPTMALDYADFQKYKGVLGKINQTFNVALNNISASAAMTEAQNAQLNITAFNVKDSATQVAANLNGLANLGARLTGLVTNEAAPVLTVSVAQYLADQDALAKINKTSASSPVYKLSVTGADMSSANSLVSDAHVQNISVIDSASTVANQIDLLQNAKVTSVSLAAGGSEMAITGAQYASNLGSLNKIKSTYRLNVTAAEAQQATALQSDTHVSRFALTTASDLGLDVASDIGVDVPTLLSMSKLDHIDFTQQHAKVALTAQQLFDAQDNQDKLRGDYAFDVTGVSMANLNDVMAVSNVGSIKVSDTSEAIATDWDALVALDPDQLASVTVTTAQTPVAITWDQWSQSASLLAKLPTQSLALLDVAPGQAATAAGYANVATVSVKGTAAEVAAEFDQLNTLADHVDDIEITDDLPLMLTQAQVDAGADTLAKINGGHYDPQIIELDSVALSS